MLNTTLSRLFCLLTAGTIALLVAPLAPAQTLNLNDAVFSEEQAKIGRRLYREHCATCHVETYFEAVMRVWNGEPLSELFSVMAAIMPQNNPGSLTDQEYIDVLAYIISASGYPQGELPLTPSDLRNIDIQPLQ